MAEARRTVLVVDDQEDERKIQCAMLMHLGFDVREAADGAEALADATAAPPDLVLLDIAMPRMDGVAVCRALRADPRTAAVPVLFFTASVVGDLAAMAAEVGAQGILAKPVDPRQVVGEVRRILGDPPA
ncbi:MAG TPA: response regulator [Longimicrobiaceae bacterium]|nr:response regulator [Longimicrobiaceae bacterium]